MKCVLVMHSRQGQLPESSYELFTCAEQIGAEQVLVFIGPRAALPPFAGRVYLLDSEVWGEFNPGAHCQAIAEIVRSEQPQLVVLEHSSFGWDLAPRLAASLDAAQISEVVAISADGYEVPCCNAKLRRVLAPATPLCVITVQSGAFDAASPLVGAVAQISEVAPPPQGGKEKFVAYEEAEAASVDLGKAEVVVSAGRGMGKAENIELVARLAAALGGELGASRPVVDAGWVEHDRQVGTTGQCVSPAMYVACGISGAVQHLAGMKKSAFIVAINKDKDAPIGEVADVLAVADAVQLLPQVLEQLG